MVRFYNLESRGTSQEGMSIPGRNMTEILVNSFAKNSKEEVIVSLRDYMGHHVVDLRAAIDKLGKALEEHGMLEQTT